MGWYYFMEETLKFPFNAKAKIKNAAGKVKLTEIQVAGLAADEEGYMDNDFDLEVLVGDHFSNILYSKLSQIKADDETPEAFAVWNNRNKKQY
jgi:hypothetical protein